MSVLRTYHTTFVDAWGSPSGALQETEHAGWGHARRRQTVVQQNSSILFLQLCMLLRIVEALKIADGAASVTIHYCAHSEVCSRPATGVG